MNRKFLIKKPSITEKATRLNEEGKYVFIVEPRATKNEIKKAVKEQYKVDVTQVNVITIPPKKRRFRGLVGLRGGYRKAIVTLKDKQKIDIE